MKPYELAIPQLSLFSGDFQPINMYLASTLCSVFAPDNE